MNLNTNANNKVKDVFCISWNGVNLGAFVNGKKLILLIILELVHVQVVIVFLY